MKHLEEMLRQSLEMSYPERCVLLGVLIMAIAVTEGVDELKSAIAASMKVVEQRVSHGS